MQIGMAEFLDNVSKVKAHKTRVEALKMNDSVVLRTILQAAYDPHVEWLIPEGRPPYTPSKLQDQQHMLIREIRLVKNFIKGFGDNINKNKREMMFIELLERLDPKDAELLCDLKDKKFPHSTTVTKGVVKEAFPDLIPE